MDRLQLLGQSWSVVAKSYRKHFVPRFRPWVLDAEAALVAAKPSPGLIFLPGCGSGDEITSLAEKLSTANSFFGLDLSEGMVDVARDVTAAISDRVQLRAGDASLVPSDLPQLSAVFTCFCLQQMPSPAEALANWSRALAPGGILVAIFWPTGMEREGPWHSLIEICPPPRRIVGWEEGLFEGVKGIDGVHIITDKLIQHEMRWPSVQEFWDAMTRGGPWHARRMKEGDEFMEVARKKFMVGKYSDPAAPLKHSPEARLVVLRRQASPSL